MTNELMLFALEDSRAFGEQVSRHLGIGLSPHEEREFEDGEHKTRPLAGVRGKDVFVIESLHADHRQSVADKLCRLLFFVGALKDAAAARVTAIVPYLGYARKDQKTQPRDPVTTRYVATLFEAVGTDCIVTLDVHNLSAFQNAFRCRTEHLEANMLFARHFASLLQERETVVMAPDAGAIKRAERFRQSLAKAMGKPVGAAFAEKHRSQGIVSGDLIVGEVKDKYVIIIDDLISTGTTIARTARGCHALGAAKVYAAASHGLFLGGADAILADDALESIAVTDTVPSFRLGNGPVKAKLSVLCSTALFAEAIRRMHDGGSISDLLKS
ncbi:ribose-phosphate pyrophosphokinase [Herminiimonas sp. CN]|uniref:ribose-phosphate diphosphokinase n=1 Tax=Herminiimonas sp. CN TaxID=1349818 RepID=UPI0004731276|nr:ribose-phosphate pyrophosphokinase [Herminiimonas sp. CN]